MQFFKSKVSFISIGYLYFYINYSLQIGFLITLAISLTITLIINYLVSKKILICLLTLHLFIFTLSLIYYHKANSFYLAAIKTSDLDARKFFIENAKSNFYATCLFNPFSLNGWKYYTKCSLFVGSDLPSLPLRIFYYDGDIQCIYGYYFWKKGFLTEAQNQFRKCSTLQIDPFLFREMY